MGVFSDFINYSPMIDRHAPRTSQARIVYKELDEYRRRVDPDHASAFAKEDEWQRITQGLSSTFGYYIVLTMPDGTEIETGQIAVSGGAPAAELKIDAACNGVVPNWTAGDIECLGSLLFPPLLLKFNGASVSGQDWGDLKARTGTPVPGVWLTTDTYQQGHSVRYTWSVMHRLGLIDTPPEYGKGLPAGFKLISSAGENPLWPSAALRQVLAHQAAVDDNVPELYPQLCRLFNIQP